MTASRFRRLEQLEQKRQEETRERVSRAMDRLTAEQRAALLAFLEGNETPEHGAAVARLREWGETVPEVRDAPDLGKAAAAWWKRLEQPGAGGLLPVASPETAEQLRQFAEQWRGVSERPDCPEQDAAQSIWGMWSYWYALALETRGEAAEF